MKPQFPVVTELLPVADLVPHRPPMILIDEVLETEGGFVRCATTVREGAAFMRDGKVSAVVSLEYMAQSLGALLGLWATVTGGKIRGGLLVGSPELDLFVSHFEMGDRLVIDCDHVWGVDDVQRFRCEVRREEAGRNATVCARATVTVLRTELGSSSEPG